MSSNPLIIVDVTSTPLDTSMLVDQIRRHDCGGIVSFEGTVRSPNKGRVVLSLEYEAYERVVVDQLRTIATEVCLEFDLPAALVVHRIGSVAVGQPAVVAASASPHRDAAFHGTHQLIDRVKAEAAIWKQEILSDSSHWL